MKNMYHINLHLIKKKISQYLSKVYNYEYSIIKKYFKNKIKIKVLEIDGAGWDIGF